MYYDGSGTKPESCSTEDVKLAQVSCTAQWKKFPCAEEQQRKKWLYLSSGDQKRTSRRKQSNKQQHGNKEADFHCSEVLLWFNFSTSVFWAGTRNCTCTASSTSHIVVHPVQEMSERYPDW